MSGHREVRDDCLVLLSGAKTLALAVGVIAIVEATVGDRGKFEAEC